MALVLLNKSIRFSPKQTSRNLGILSQLKNLFGVERGVGDGNVNERDLKSARPEEREFNTLYGNTPPPTSHSHPSSPLASFYDASVMAERYSGKGKRRVGREIVSESDFDKAIAAAKAAKARPRQSKSISLESEEDEEKRKEDEDDEEEDERVSASGLTTLAGLLREQVRYRYIVCVCVW